MQSIQSSIKSLQKQLDNITAHINYQARNEASQAAPRPLSQSERHVSEAQSSFIPPLQATSLAENDRINLSDLQFHGPSSSEYGLNIAQVMLRQSSGSDITITWSDHQNNSDIDEMTTVTEELNNNGSWGGGDVFHQPLDAPCTVPVHRLLSKADTFRLLHVYQEVIGNFYPILNLQSLGEEAERLHDCGGIDLGLRRGNSSHVDNDSILILNLVCSIALTAETTGISKIAQVFYESAQSAIQTNVTARKLQIRDVVLVLLAVCCKYSLPILDIYLRVHLTLIEHLPLL